MIAKTMNARRKTRQHRILIQILILRQKTSYLFLLFQQQPINQSGGNKLIEHKMSVSFYYYAAIVLYQPNKKSDALIGK